MSYWIVAADQSLPPGERGRNALFMCAYGWTADRREAWVFHEYRNAEPWNVTPPETGAPRFVDVWPVKLSDLRELGVSGVHELPAAPPTGARKARDVGSFDMADVELSEGIAQRVTDAIADEFGTDNDHAVACIAIGAHVRALEAAGFAVMPQRATDEMLKAAAGGHLAEGRGDADEVGERFAERYQQAVMARPRIGL